MQRTIIIFTSVLLAFACSESGKKRQTQSGSEVSGSEPAPPSGEATAISATVGFRHLMYGFIPTNPDESLDFNGEHILNIQSEEDFKAILKKLGKDQGSISIDFSKEQVIGYLLRLADSGQDMDIANIYYIKSDTGDSAQTTLEVDVAIQESSGDDCAAASVVSYHYHFVAMPKYPETPILKKRTYKGTCNKDNQLIVKNLLKGDYLSDFPENPHAQEFSIQSKTDLNLLPESVRNNSTFTQIDFNQERILGIGQSRSSGGYKLEITNIQELKYKIVAKVLSQSPGPNCIVASALTQPHHFIALPQSHKPVFFQVSNEELDCQ